MNNFDLKVLEKKLKLLFKSRTLLEQALTHSSYAYAHHLQDNERLEFLGDAILSAIIAEDLYKKNPNLAEGDLTKMRAQIVQGSSLAEVARGLGLENYLRHELQNPSGSCRTLPAKTGQSRGPLAHGEKNISPTALDNLLEQAFEALVGAMFLEFGYDKTRTKVLGWISVRRSFGEGGFNPKGALQEFLQPQVTVEDIDYRVVQEKGPSHNREFTVELYIKGKFMASATANSKKKAQELAAAEALKKLKI